MIDEMQLVTSALAAGAGAVATGMADGAKDVANTAVKDAYARLKAELRRVMHADPEAQTALARHDAKPDVWQAPLLDAIQTTGAATDPGVVLAAQQLLAVIDAKGMRSGKYVIDVHKSAGTVIGDNAHVTQHFTAPT